MINMLKLIRGSSFRNDLLQNPYFNEATKTIKPSLRKGGQSQERKKQGNVSGSSMKSFLTEDSSDEDIGINNSKKSSKKVCRNFKGFQTTTTPENEVKTTKSLPEKNNLGKGNNEKEKATKIHSFLESSDEEITFKNPIMKSHRKEKQRTESTSPLRRSPRKSVQLQRKAFFFAYIHIFS